MDSSRFNIISNNRLPFSVSLLLLLYMSELIWNKVLYLKVKGEWHLCYVNKMADQSNISWIHNNICSLTAQNQGYIQQGFNRKSHSPPHHQKNPWIRNDHSLNLSFFYLTIISVLHCFWPKQVSSDHMGLLYNQQISPKSGFWTPSCPSTIRLVMSHTCVKLRVSLFSYTYFTFLTI